MAAGAPDRAERSDRSPHFDLDLLTVSSISRLACRRVFSCPRPGLTE